MVISIVDAVQRSNRSGAIVSAALIGPTLRRTLELAVTGRRVSATQHQRRSPRAATKACGGGPTNFIDEQRDEHDRAAGIRDAVDAQSRRTRRRSMRPPTAAEHASECDEQAEHHPAQPHDQRRQRDVPDDEHPVIIIAGRGRRPRSTARSSAAQSLRRRSLRGDAAAIARRRADVPAAPIRATGRRRSARRARRRAGRGARRDAAVEPPSACRMADAVRRSGGDLRRRAACDAAVG